MMVRQVHGRSYCADSFVIGEHFLFNFTKIIIKSVEDWGCGQLFILYAFSSVYGTSIYLIIFFDFTSIPDINVNYSVDRITNNLSEMKLQKYPVFKLSIIETICNTHVCPLKRYSDC
jgi:hypothetical protein